MWTALPTPAIHLFRTESISVQYLYLFPHCFIYKTWHCTVHMNLNTLPVVSIYLWHHSKCSCMPARSHTEYWLSSMHLCFHIVHIKERTSKFCIFTNCFKMSAVSCFMNPIDMYLCFNQNFETHIFCFKLPLDNFQTDFNSI